MTEREPDFSRIERKKGRKRTNRTLNILIAVVVLLIVITASTIFLGNNNEKQADEKEVVNTETDDNSSEGANKPEDAAKTDETNKTESSTETESEDSEETTVSGDEENSEDSKDSGTVTYGPSDDKVIAETVVDTAWEPIGTTQTGDHTSQYDGNSVDWNEKKQALAYATGLSENEMIFLKIKNGGGPQKSIGIVSSKDKSEKYRVYLEWVDGQGWKPVKMDKLTTLEFDY